MTLQVMLLSALLSAVLVAIGYSVKDFMNIIAEAERRG